MASPAPPRISSAAAASQAASPAIRPWPAVGTLCRRELVRFVRQPNRVVGALGQPLVFWLLFSEGLKRSGLDYGHFLPGTIVLILLFTAIFATISIIEDRREGFLQSVLVAPIPRWAMVLGKVFGGALLALLQGLLFLLLGWLTVELTSNPLNLLAGVVMMAVIALALTGLGFLIAWRMESTQGFHAIMSVFLLPMWLLSGAFFPSGQSGWLGWIVALNPLTYGVAGLRRLLQYTQQDVLQAVPPLSVCWLVTVLFAMTTLSLACFVARTRTSGDLL
ncbi:MAG: ABC transporter permease [Pirellulales bacterium]